MKILGISAFYHDSAAALLVDGEIVAAAQQERFSRRKHDPEFPKDAVDYCLREAGITIEDLDCVAFYDKPFVKFERLLMTFLGEAPKGLRAFFIHTPPYLKERLFMRGTLKRLLGYEGEITFCTHHQSHAAAAFFPSPYEEAAILTVDGVGEWASTAIGEGKGNTVRLLKEINFPHSLGLLYSAFTYFCGFKVNSGEYKLMGLAPYGEPKYVDTIKRELIDIKPDGSYRLNMKYFDYTAGLRMTNRKFGALFGGPEHPFEAKMTQREMDLARSVQVVTEEILLKLAHTAHRMTGQRYLCLAGGVALNCVANGRILREAPFDDIWIQPAAGDAGNALGAALFTWHQVQNQPRTPHAKRQKASYLGPGYSDEEIGAWLHTEKIPHREMNEHEVADTVAGLLASEQVVGWFQGRMEFGPRALGARSILGDPRSRAMQSVLNLKIKFRESFRPFAPSVLRERAHEYFEIAPEHSSPYMLLVADVRPALRTELTAEDRTREGFDKLKVIRSELPAITHVDNSARIQTVERKDHPRYYDLIQKFYEKTGCAVLINTSFNVRGEPIVCTPQQAYTCFMRTNMDYLCLGRYLLDKKEQPSVPQNEKWKEEFELD